MFGTKARVKQWLGWDEPKVSGIRGVLRHLLKKYSHWNWSWHIGRALRYAPVIQVIKDTGLVDPIICDVGSGSKGGITPYLRGEAIGVDIYFDAETVKRHPLLWPVRGSGAHLPLASGTCDIVVCIDTLEHLTGEQRPEVINELFRIVKDGGWVMVGAPCGEEARRCEERVNALYKQKVGQDHHILIEHLENRFSTVREMAHWIEEAATKHLGRYGLKAEGNVNLELWYRLQLLLLLERPIPLLSQFQRLTFQPLFPLLVRRNEEPCYRRIFVVHGFS